MKSKKLLNLSAIILGVFMCFGLGKVQANEITSNFSGATLSRATLQSTLQSNALDTVVVPRTLGISVNRESGDGYTWNPNTTSDAKTVWKIADVDSSNTRSYSNLYYCLNATRGFGITNGEMAEGSKDTYVTQLDMKTASNKTNIQNYSGGNLGTNYNKVLWILDNSYIPTKSASYINSTAYKALMNKARITIDNEEGLDLTEDDIEVVQQMAIWYFTNTSESSYNNSALPSLYINGEQLSSKYFGTTEHGTGATRQSKANTLYRYFINNASSTYTGKTSTLTLSNSNATVTESGNDYIVGPFSLTGTNTSDIKSITATINKNYTLLDSSKNTVSNNDFTEVVGGNFYLKISKNSITSSAAEVTINLTYTYNTRILTFLTDENDPTNTQPVVLVQEGSKPGSTSTNITIQFTQVDVEKVWEDNQDQDGKRLSSIVVALYENGTQKEEKTLSASNTWKYTWSNLLSGKTYTVKELNTSGTAINNNGRYNDDYTKVTYSTTGTKTTITNIHTPETITINGTKTWDDSSNQDGIRPNSITVKLLANGTVKESKTVSSPWTYSFTNLPKYENGREITYTIDEDTVTGYTKTITGYNIKNTHTVLIPDLALRKYITSIDGTEIASNNDNYRVPQINTSELDNGTKTTAKYVHKKDPITVQTGNKVVYNITVYNEGEKDARASKITDQLPTGLKFTRIITSGYTADYTESTNRLVITKTGTNNLSAYTKNGSLSSETVQVECEVVAIATENRQILTNIAWISEMKDANGTFTSDIDSQTTTSPNYNKDNMSDYTRPNNDGYYPGNQDDDDFDRIVILPEEEPETVNKTVIKEWSDNDNQDGIRPTSVEVQLYKSIDETKTSMGDSYKVTLNSTNNWRYTWTGLAKKENGKTVTYSVEETAISNYTTTYSANNYSNTDTITITNIHNSEPVNPDLALRKFITKIGNKTYNREPQIGDWTLDNGTTVTKSHSKDPITVETGDIVTYKIRIYNEGNVDGKATLVTDYLPSGLELVSDNEINQRYRWNIGTTANGYTAVSTNYLNNTTIEAYSGRGVPEYVDLEIVCKVTAEAGDNNKNLKNIAEITTAEYSRGTNDIDSTPGDVTASDAYNPTHPTTGRGEYDDDDFELLVLEPRKLDFDLALRKFITSVKKANTGDVKTYNRAPVVDTSTIPTTGTATYKHIKTPIAVQKGDIVTYTIRVYNEGEIDGYVEKITDHLPDNLIPIVVGMNGIDSQKYANEIEFNTNWGWIIGNDSKSVTTMKTAKVNSDTYSLLEGFENVTDTKLNAYVEGSDTLDYIDVQIKCLVTDQVVSGEYLTNIAEITDAKDINNVQGDGRDSSLNNVDCTNLADYKNTEALASNNNSYVPGQEDDDDFEKLIVKEFDLALRKFITKVNETSYSRAPEVDASKLGTIVDGKRITTATYRHSKEPVIVNTEDVITYKIRIYNEGTLDGFANEITDDIPSGLEFLPNSSVNVSNNWRMLDSEGNETDDVSKAVMITTNKLSDDNQDNIIRAVSEVDGVKALSYKDVEVQFKVIAKAEKSKDNIIINEAQISADSDDDIDSIPHRDEKYNYETGINEDDIDYEPIKLQYFDLALRKFITKVNTIDYNNRYPEVIYNDDGSITYKHTKDPVSVETGDTVVYTIRVYNEGEKSGYATEITDNLPDGLEFLPDNETNKEYGWKLVDKDGNETEDLSKATKFTTDYLKDELLEAFKVEDGTKVLSYKDVQIAFKVVEPNTSDRVLVNTAEISKDSDEDIDSTPGNNELAEDDIDREYLKVKYFDLALKKWVTATKVTYNGKTKTTKTGFTENSEGIAKVDLASKKLKKTTVKFVYSIKVINEGEVPGYAYEVKDYIPKGLKFVASDNKDWKEIKNGVVVTDKLKDTLLQPGESATVEIVLTWKNSSTNMGLKTNYAEISNDSGYDIDSTPNNYKLNEDDIDDAQVILSIKTAGAKTYIGLVLISVMILAGGALLIKKYVIK